MVLKTKILKKMKDWNLHPKEKRVIVHEQYEKFNGKYVELVVERNFDILFQMT